MAKHRGYFPSVLRNLFIHQTFACSRSRDDTSGCEPKVRRPYVRKCPLRRQWRPCSSNNRGCLSKVSKFRQLSRLQRQWTNDPPPSSKLASGYPVVTIPNRAASGPVIGVGVVRVVPIWVIVRPWRQCTVDDSASHDPRGHCARKPPAPPSAQSPRDEAGKACGDHF